MNLKSIVFALVFAGSVTAGAHVFIRQASMKQPPRPTKQVVQVIGQVRRGQPLMAPALKVVRVDASAVPPGAVVDLESAVGRVARSTILPGILLKTQLMQAGGSGLPALIQPGYVAHTIKLPAASAGLLPFLRPKDHIDVQLVLNARGGATTGQSRDSRVIRLLRNVEILAVGDRMSDYEEKKDVKSKSKTQKTSRNPSIALLLTKAQSLRLGLGERKGELVVTLRNPLADSAAETEVDEFTLSELFGDIDEAVKPVVASPTPVATDLEPSPPVQAVANPPNAEAKSAQPASRRIVVYYGTQRSEHTLKLRRSAPLTVVAQ